VSKPGFTRLLAYSSTTNIKAMCPSEKLVNFYQAMIHGATSQENVLFIGTAMRTSNYIMAKKVLNYCLVVCDKIHISVTVMKQF
jgi:acetylornithine/succinyldiaminopimelate/putrescine aminotransferase